MLCTDEHKLVKNGQQGRDNKKKIHLRSLSGVQRRGSGQSSLASVSRLSRHYAPSLLVAPNERVQRVIVSIYIDMLAILSDVFYYARHSPRVCGFCAETCTQSVVGAHIRPIWIRYLAAASRVCCEVYYTHPAKYASHWSSAF